MILKNKILHSSQKKWFFQGLRLLQRAVKQNHIHREDDNELKSEYVILGIDYES